MDTIFALASASGKAGVSVIRISGSRSLDACRKLGVNLLDHDRRLVKLRDQEGQLIDQVFALSFAQGRSFTGEQVVELQTHGSPAIVKAILSMLDSFGLRHAAPGEFTRRAMENGKLDLAQVEGLADLIDAETEGQRKQAIRVFSGALGKLVEGWRQKLIRASALLEATIDFVDEDVPIDVYPEVSDLVGDVAREVAIESKGVRIRERMRDGFEVAIVGPPNSGKSTLLNRLAGRDAAITSDIAGTTRDVIEVKMDLDGFPVTFLDTAGIRESSDKLEELGIVRGRERAALADVRVYLSNSGQPSEEIDGAGLDIFAVGKADTLEAPSSDLNVSGLTGLGVDRLLEKISAYFEEQISGAGIAIRARHESALNLALTELEVVQLALRQPQLPVDVIAEDLRTAIRSLDILVGRIDVENVLGEIFSSFCIGK